MVGNRSKVVAIAPVEAVSVVDIARRYQGQSQHFSDQANWALNQ
jgi:hypothetical protein